MTPAANWGPALNKYRTGPRYGPLPEGDEQGNSPYPMVPAYNNGVANGYNNGVSNGYPNEKMSFDNQGFNEGNERTSTYM